MQRKIRLLSSLILAIGLILQACGTPPVPAATPTTAYPDSEFVSAHDGKFILHGKPYYFAGANFWQGMNMASKGTRGNRPQLLAELDHMQALGLTNLRIMASSEGPATEPYRMVPPLMVEPGVYDLEVLDGLDFLLAEMGKRNMRAVMVLTNYWQWSGGMAQYVSWSKGSPIPYPNQTGDWNGFMEYSALFYSCAECQTWYRAHIGMLVNHVNPYTGRAYRDDPAIFSWELANEPRRYPDAWIDESAAYIKSLDPNHMVTTGSEGSPPGENRDFKAAHNGPNIDYATIHIWPQNWGWYDPSNPSSYAAAEKKALTYLRQHVVDAAILKKPLVLEEFGLARDGEDGQDNFAVGASTIHRNRLYQALYNEVTALLAKGGLVGGDNFWAWAGAARPGDPWIGDPPHETPGWYSVYDIDSSTLAIISAHAVQMNAAGMP
jgi:mannan endo-1,4-beta-mannosidase